MDLQGDVELEAFLRAFEEQRLAQGAPGKTGGLTALGPEPRRAEGNAEGIRVDRSELEGGAVGTDGLHADGPAPDGGSQSCAHRNEPLARVVGGLDQPLGEPLEPDDLALGDSGGLLLLRQREGVGAREAGVNEHDGGRGSCQQSLRVADWVGGIALGENGGFGRIAVKLGGDSSDRVAVGDRVDDVARGQLRIEHQLPIGHALDGIHQIQIHRVLQNVSARAGFQRLVDQRVSKRAIDKSGSVPQQILHGHGAQRRLGLDIRLAACGVHLLHSDLHILKLRQIL